MIQIKLQIQNDIDFYTSPFHEMYVRFDLGRLDEILGNYDNAINNYQQAATLGPKTWLGQEAGRRLSMLTATDDTGVQLQ